MGSYYVLFLAGQLSSGLVIDATGAFGVAVQAPSPLRLGGAGVVFVAAVTLQLLRHRVCARRSVLPELRYAVSES